MDNTGISRPVETLLHAGRAGDGSRFFFGTVSNFKTCVHVGQADMGRRAIGSQLRCGANSGVIDWPPAGLPSRSPRFEVSDWRVLRHSFVDLSHDGTAQFQSKRGDTQTDHFTSLIYRLRMSQSAMSPVRMGGRRHWWTSLFFIRIIRRTWLVHRMTCSLMEKTGVPGERKTEKYLLSLRR